MPVITLRCPRAVASPPSTLLDTLGTVEPDNKIITRSRPYKGNLDFAIKAAYKKSNFFDLANLDILSYVITNC
jgi:hypothetical protein